MSYVVYKLSSGKWCVYCRGGQESYRIATYKTRKQALTTARLLAGHSGLVVIA